MRLQINENFTQSDWETLINYCRLNPKWMKFIVRNIENGEKRSVEKLNKQRALSPEELMAVFGMLPDDWDVVDCKINKWEVGAKLKDENGNPFIATTPLFQTKLTVKPSAKTQAKAKCQRRAAARS